MSLKNFIKKSSKLVKETSQTFKGFQKKVNKLKNNLKDRKGISRSISIEPHKKDIKTERMVVDLSVNSVAKSTFTIISILVLVYFLYLIKSILLIFFVSLFLASVFNPGVDFFERKGISRSIGLVICYILVLALLIFLVGSLVPIIIEQIKEITNNIGIYVNTLFNDENINLPFANKWMPLINDLWSTVDREEIILTLKTTLENLGSKLGDWTGNALGAIITISAGLLNMVMVLFITFFIVIDKQNLHSFFLSLFPSRHGGYLSTKIHTMQEKIGDWIRGQILLSIVMGIISFIAFKILGIKYATTLALISGISEFVPYVGPIVTFASAALIAINQGTTTFLLLIVAYVIIQTLEGNVLVPLIMSKSVGINPIIVIIAMLVGWQFLGILGMILAVPLAKIIAIFVEDYQGRVK